ncbi:MAG: hypothetical protein JO316_14080 [Abitibacteriaceae bacterium]|nr:hypothetical protein [Abditibacteriaceae bacterium]MBV9866477.1 hypothetical protein [Abditibacteriaceae bacterium]
MLTHPYSYLHRTITEPLRFADGRTYDVLHCDVEVAGTGRRCVVELLERKWQMHLEFQVYAAPELNSLHPPALVQYARRRIIEYLTIHRHPLPRSRAEQPIHIQLQS